MIPNCIGCKIQMEECYIAQQEGADAGLEGMGKREHCCFFVINPKTGKFIVPIYDKEDAEQIK